MISCAFDTREALAIAEMKRAGGVDSDANLVRIALWSLADHMGLDLPLGVLGIEPFANPACPTLTYPHGNLHPWRRRAT